MKKNNHLHPFIKWHMVLGQKSVDIKNGHSLPYPKEQELIDSLHKEIEAYMVSIQKGTIDKIQSILRDMYDKKIFAIKRMCMDELLYIRVSHFACRITKSLSDIDTLDFRKQSWETYNANRVTKFPELSKRRN